MTEEQFDQVLTDAAAKIAGRVELPPQTKLAETATECKKIMTQLQKAGESP